MGGGRGDIPQLWLTDHTKKFSAQPRAQSETKDNLLRYFITE